MSTHVLVAYATRYGSTGEVAEKIGETLRGSGLEVTVLPAREVETLEGYGPVVLGAPIFIGAWHKDALGFLSEHREALAGRPVAIFALGPLWGSPEDEDWRKSRSEFDQELAKVSWLTPVAVELFGGKYDPAKLRVLDRLAAALPASPLHNVPASDARDWAAIAAWANSLAVKLETAAPPAVAGA